MSADLTASFSFSCKHCGAQAESIEDLPNGMIRVYFECGGEVTLKKTDKLGGSYRAANHAVCGSLDPEDYSAADPFPTPGARRPPGAG